MNDWDYLNFKSLAVASVLRSAKSNEFDLARAELVASQVCGGSEVDVLLSSFRTLSVYLRTLNALGMHDKAVATFTDAEDRNWDYQSEDEEGWHSCVCEAVTALGKSGRAQDAWDLVKDVDRRHLSTDIFESLGDAYEAGDSPEGVVQVFRFADREGMATDHLVRKAILAYTTMNKHENVILHAKMLGARRKKGGRLIAGVSARERRGKKRLEDSDYGWWSSLVGARAWAMGEGQEKDDVLYAIVKAARKVEFEKFLMYVVKTAAAAEKEGKSKPLEGRTLAAAIDTCGFNVRRRGKGGCRGEPVADFERDFKEAEWDEKVKKGRRNLKKVLDVAESWGLTTDDSVMASASRAWRALGKPYHNYDIIKKSMKSQVRRKRARREGEENFYCRKEEEKCAEGKILTARALPASQKIPQPSVFAQTMMGALETSDSDLVSKVSILFKSSGYDFDASIYEDRERRRRERLEKRMKGAEGGGRSGAGEHKRVETLT